LAHGASVVDEKPQPALRLPIFIRLADGARTEESFSVTRRATFRWRDSPDKDKKRLMTLPGNEFLRRFLLQVLAPGFLCIRPFGFLA
jgi:hypothetical protein